VSALRSPRAALAFLTPIGGAADPTPGAVAWFPVVGAGLGGLLGYLWWLTEHIWPVGVAAALVLTADLALTGLLHFDGLVDSADGLLPHLTRVRRLDVMAGRPDELADRAATLGKTAGKNGAGKN